MRGAMLAPGDHLLKAVTVAGKKESGRFKVHCDIAESCLPGDLVVVPASDVLQMQTLPVIPAL